MKNDREIGTRKLFTRRQASPLNERRESFQQFIALFTVLLASLSISAAKDFTSPTLKSFPRNQRDGFVINLNFSEGDSTLESNETTTNYKKSNAELIFDID